MQRKNVYMLPVFTIDTVFNFDANIGIDTNTNVTCEQGFTTELISDCNSKYNS